MRTYTITAIRALGAALIAFQLVACQPQEQQSPRSFRSPEAAVREMLALIGRHDEAAVERLFGPGSVDLISSGDPYEDRADFARVKSMIEERVEFLDFDDHTRVALFGKQAWPFPIPLVRDDAGRWHFDLDEGREELLNRRIGNNELETIATLHAVAEAQQEYAGVPRDGRPRGFARQFRSKPGAHDGLYWTPQDGEDPSPLGDLVAGAELPAQGARPFHGYFFRILDRQGAAAPGGAQSYLDAQGVMNQGFAVLAWPARYGNSGVMTFLINQRGIVFQKDLGARTEEVAPLIDAFDPDASWDPVVVPAP